MTLKGSSNFLILWLPPLWPCAAGSLECGALWRRRPPDCERCVGPRGSQGDGTLPRLSVQGSRCGRHCSVFPSPRLAGLPRQGGPVPVRVSGPWPSRALSARTSAFCCLPLFELALRVVRSCAGEPRTEGGASGASV